MSTLAVLDRYKTLLSESAAFQTLCGEVNAALALNHIFIEVEDGGAVNRTDGQLVEGYGVIINDGQESEAVAGGTKNFFMQSGEVIIQIVSPVAGANQLDDGLAHAAFAPVLESIKAELEANAGLGTFVSSHGVRIPKDAINRSLEEDIPG